MKHNKYLEYRQTQNSFKELGYIDPSSPSSSSLSSKSRLTAARIAEARLTQEESKKAPENDQSQIIEVRRTESYIYELPSGSPKSPKPVSIKSDGCCVIS